MPGTVVARNLATNPAVVARVQTELVPLQRTIRNDRTQLREQWLRYHRIWSVRNDQPSYHGRTNVFVPLGRKLVENWVTRVKRDLFPDTDWFEVRARRQDAERRVPGVKELLRYFFTRHMNLKRAATPWIRQLVLYGTSPVRCVWRTDERLQTVLQQITDPEGHPTGRYEESVAKVLDYLGPTFRPVDLFAWYVHPVTVADVDDAILSFEDMLIPRERLFATAAKLLDPRDDPKNPQSGHVYENLDQVRERLDGEGQSARDKIDAEARRLADKGFPTQLDGRYPAAVRPIDLTEAMWTTDLDGEGPKRWLITTACDDVILRVQENPFWHGGSMWLCGKFVELVDEFYGRGLPEIFDTLQYFGNDLANQSADALVWSTNPIAVVDMYGVQDPTSIRMRPGAKWLASKGSVSFETPPQGPAASGFAALAQIMGIVNEVGNVTPAGALGAAQRARGRAQQTASGMQLLVSEGAVDVREVVEHVEDQVFRPLLRRSHQLAQQFLDRDVILKVAGTDGAALIEMPVGVADLVGDYDLEWLGSLQALNSQVRGQQMVNFLGMVAKIPSELLQQQGVRVNLVKLLRDIWGIGFGLRGADQIVQAIHPEFSTDWRMENDVFRAGHGGEVQVSPADPHEEHLKGHDLVLQDPKVDVITHQQVMAHMREHATALAVAHVQELQAQQAALMPPAPPGAPGAPEQNGMVGGPRVPAPLGPGRMAQTGSLDDLMRQLPRPETANGGGA